MSGKKKPTMTREQAGQLYDDLRKAMATAMAKKGRNLDEELAKIRGEMASSPGGADAAIRAAMGGGGVKTSITPKNAGTPGIAALAGLAAQGSRAARREERHPISRTILIGMVACAFGRVVLGGLELTGVLEARTAVASMRSMPAQIVTGPQFSKEQLTLLKSLDARRAELEKRGRDIESKELEMGRRDAEFAVRLAQLRELTNRIKTGREVDEKKKGAQISQLANVYGSMNPPEAAQLIQQLDTPIALDLLKQMPEKRIGQILALMTPEKALSITRLLSGVKPIGAE